MDLPTSTQFQHHYCQVTTFVKHVQNIKYFTCNNVDYLCQYLWSTHFYANYGITCQFIS